MKYIAEAYEGTKCGNNFNFRKGVQIVAIDETGKRRYVFIGHETYRTYRTPCHKIWEGVAHYKSGLNKRDGEAFDEAMIFAQETAERWTQAGTHE